MRKVLLALTRLAAAVGVAGALSFGALEAMPTSDKACNYNPPSELGACTNPDDCQSACQEYGGQSICGTDGCCYCVI